MKFVPAQFLKIGLVGVLLGTGSLAFAQNSEISIGTASGQPNSDVDVPVTFDANNHDIANFDLDIAYDDTQLSLRSGGDACGFIDIGPAATANSNPVNCTDLGGGVLRVLVDAPATFPIPALPTGELFSVRFTIASGATTGTTTPVTFDSVAAADTAAVTVDPANITTTDGEVDIVSGPQSELEVTPNPMAFGTVDLGNMPVTDTFTVQNIGSNASSTTISAVALNGPDAEFTIIGDTCTGTTLNGGTGGNGDTCSIDIEFDAAANGPYSNQLEITSDANINDNPLVDITGSADSVANLSVNPAFGPVDLGDVLVGNSTTANGSVSNSGSADGTFSCDASGLPAEITVSPDLSGGVTVPAGGSVDFSITCAVPSSATAGTVYSGDLVCSGDLSGTHTISCEATQFVPPENIPSLSQWGLIIMSVLMLMIGLVSVRFFRA